jgi:hypothetical protein
MRWRLLSRPGLREVAVFALALLAYQATRALSIGNAQDAFAHSWNVIELEKAAGIFVEPAIQVWALGHTGLVEALNTAYLVLHLPVTIAFFVWLYRRRPSAYPLVRSMFITANAIAAFVFVVFPAAPPRLLQGAGLVDTLQTVSDVDLHGGRLSGWFNPYAAVPSMHFGYALVIGVTIAVVVRRPIWRAVGLAYPAFVLFMIVATGNHFLLDAAAGAAVVGLAVGATAAWGRYAHWTGTRRTVTTCGRVREPVGRNEAATA